MTLTHALPPPGDPWGYCVLTRDGRRSLFLDHAMADGYAARQHGAVVVPLMPGSLPAWAAAGAGPADRQEGGR